MRPTAPHHGCLPPKIFCDKSLIKTETYGTDFIFAGFDPRPICERSERRARAGQADEGFETGRIFLFESLVTH